MKLEKKLMASNAKVSLTQISAKTGSGMSNAKEMNRTGTYPITNNNNDNNIVPAPISKINFEKLIMEFKVTSIPPLTMYLKDIWKDLSDRSEEKGKGLTLLTFSKVIFY